MGLLQMSFYGTVMILVVTLIRTVAVNRLPKRTFLILWGVILLRLLLPFQITSTYSVYTLLGRTLADIGEQRIAAGEAEDTPVYRFTEETGDREMRAQEEGGQSSVAYGNRAGRQDAGLQGGMGVSMKEQGTVISVWHVIYGVGAAACALFFLVTYACCRREFGMSLPVSNDYVSQWLEERCEAVSSGRPSWRGRVSRWRLQHAVTVRVSDKTDTPLTYGVIKPVILLPKQTAWEQTEQLSYVLWHEYTHICYGDNVLKVIMVAALCLHWFNPFVWVMYVLFNRDMELACDESVLRRCGIGTRTVYANMLIAMEAGRSGLMPLGNHFSHNAIEERVCAIMKIKKRTAGAVLLAAGLVAGVTMAFATSAAAEATDVQRQTRLSQEGREEQQEAGDAASILTESVNGSVTAASGQMYDQLAAFYLDGYEHMTVAEYRKQIGRLTDSVESMEFLERYFQDEAWAAMYENAEAWEELAARGYEDLTFYLYFAMEPLLGDRWQERDFSGCVSVVGRDDWGNVGEDMATFEYTLVLDILDADRLTVGEYIDTRLQVNEGLRDIFAAGCTVEELAVEESIGAEIGYAVNALQQRLKSDTLQVIMAYDFSPSDALAGSEPYADYQQEREADWEEVLKPYLDYGLTAYYDAQQDEGKMFFQGKEVRGILDEEQGIWITEHSGIGEGIYAADAIEVYAVYENGALTGLREATAKEQEEIDRRRRQDSVGGGADVEEIREFLPGTAEDYHAMLSLKKPNVAQMSLADFNAALLTWGNANNDGYDRILCDVQWNDFDVDLSEEDKTFVTRTVNLSSKENGMYVRSLYIGEPEEDVCLGDALTREQGDGAANVWCQMYYQFCYHIADKEKVTVGERDRCVGGMLQGIEDFWEQTDIEALLQMEKADIMAKLEELARAHSTQNITITIPPEDQIGFEHMDERALMEERRQTEGSLGY